MTISRANWLVEYHKNILDLIVGTPGSTHHAHYLNNKRLYKKRMAGEGLPDKIVNLREKLGEISEVNIDDSASPHFQLVTEII